MKYNLRFIFLIVVLSLLLLPFLLISFYNVPSADDLCRIRYGETITTYISTIGRWYNHINGRYFDAILTSIPIWYNLFFYKFLFILFSTFFMFSIFHMTKVLIPTLSKKMRILISLSILVFFLIKIPRVSTGFYWLASLTTYLFSFTLYIFLVRILFKTSINNTVKAKNWIFSFLLIFCTIGCHEVTMTIVDFSLFMYLLYCLRIKKNILFSLILNVLSWICSALVYFSPGNDSRQERYPEGRRILLSLKESFVEAIGYIYQIFKDPFIIISSILLIILFNSIFRKVKMNKVKLIPHPLINGFLVFVFVYLVYFVYNYSGMNFGVVAYNRYGNIVFFYFVFIWILFLYSTASLLSKKWIGHQLMKLKWVTTFLIFYLLFSSFFTRNFKNVFIELYDGVALKYYKEWMWRKQFVQKQKERVITVPKIYEIPSTIFFRDITQDENHWINGCYCASYAPGKKIKISDLDVPSSRELYAFLKELELFPPSKIMKDSTFVMEEVEENFQLFYSHKKPVLLLSATDKANIAIRFFLHIYPLDRNDLPPKRRKYKSDNLDFNWNISEKGFNWSNNISKFRLVKLPKYKYHSFSIGQFDKQGKKWEKKIKITQ